MQPFIATGGRPPSRAGSNISRNSGLLGERVASACRNRNQMNSPKRRRRRRTRHKLPAAQLPSKGERSGNGEVRGGVKELVPDNPDFAALARDETIVLAAVAWAHRLIAIPLTANSVVEGTMSCPWPGISEGSVRSRGWARGGRATLWREGDLTKKPGRREVLRVDLLSPVRACRIGP